MSEAAAKKLKDEMEKNRKNAYVQAVGTFLLQQLENHPENSEKILAEDKTIIKSFNVMRKEAEKKKVGNYAVLTDQEGFAIVLNYFDIKPDGLALDTNSTPVAKESTVNEGKSVEFDVKLDDLLEESK